MKVHLEMFYVASLYSPHWCLGENMSYLKMATMCETVTQQMLQNTWRETAYRLDILTSMKGAHVEVF
jgi:cytochrome P450